MTPTSNTYCGTTDILINGKLSGIQLEKSRYRCFSTGTHKYRLSSLGVRSKGITSVAGKINRCSNANNTTKLIRDKPLFNLNEECRVERL